MTSNATRLGIVNLNRGNWSNLRLLHVIEAVKC